mmetsp:Transcript_38096/g.34074  ORF Transcript_38096/g.34074 Transcript_38096/m.34074 type:complete len:92 (-) Transcript_38096:238-513(-)
MYRSRGGTITTTPCLPGYFGLFCQECSRETFKVSYSNGECTECESQPHSRLEKNGTSNYYMCAYDCYFAYDSEGTKFCDDNIIEFAWHKGI